MQFLAGMGVRKVPDAKAVCGVQLAHEELAAGLPHGDNLEDGGGREKDLNNTYWLMLLLFSLSANLHIFFTHHQLASVGEIH